MYIYIYSEEEEERKVTFAALEANGSTWEKVFIYNNVIIHNLDFTIKTTAINKHTHTHTHTYIHTLTSTFLNPIYLQRYSHTIPIFV